MTEIRVTDDFSTVESIVFDWLLLETGDQQQAAQIAASGYVEQVLAVNPDLARKQALNVDTLPRGTVITLPERPDAAIRQTVKLWD